MTEGVRLCNPSDAALEALIDRAAALSLECDAYVATGDVCGKPVFHDDEHGDWQPKALCKCGGGYHDRPRFSRDVDGNLTEHDYEPQGPELP